MHSESSKIGATIGRHKGRLASISSSVKCPFSPIVGINSEKFGPQGRQFFCFFNFHELLLRSLSVHLVSPEFLGRSESRARGSCPICPDYNVALEMLLLFSLSETSSSTQFFLAFFWNSSKVPEKKLIQKAALSVPEMIQTPTRSTKAIYDT